MTKKKNSKKRQEPGRPVETDKKTGEAVAKLLSELNRNNGCAGFDQLASFADGTVRLPGIMLAIQVLSDPFHPKNDTPYILEYIRVDGSDYIRLVPKPPKQILERLKATESNSYLASNKIEMLNPENQSEDRKADGSPNPYPIGTDSFMVFNMGSNWISRSDLLSKVANKICNGDRSKAQLLIHIVGTPCENEEKSLVEEKDSAGNCKMIRFVQVR